MRLEKTKKLLLIDTFGLMYRFFYTLPRMNAPDGTPTNAVYGLARVLMKLMRESGADYIVPAMESKIPTFRHEMYPVIRGQIPYFGHLRSFGDIIRIYSPGYARRIPKTFVFAFPRTLLYFSAFFQLEKFLNAHPRIENKGAKRACRQFLVLWYGEINSEAGLHHD